MIGLPERVFARENTLAGPRVCTTAGCRTGLFAKNYKEDVDMSKVRLDVIKPWIKNKIVELMGFEDEFVYEY